MSRDQINFIKKYIECYVVYKKKIINFLTILDDVTSHESVKLGFVRIVKILWIKKNMYDVKKWLFTVRFLPKVFFYSVISTGR